jgi:hypothetical protein
MYPELFIFSASSLFIFYGIVFYGLKSILWIIFPFTSYFLFASTRKNTFFFVLMQLFLAYYFFSVVNNNIASERRSLNFSYALVVGFIKLKNKFYRYSIVPLGGISSGQYSIISRTEVAPLDIVVIPPYANNTKKPKYISLINSRLYFDNTLFSCLLPARFFLFDHFLKPSLVKPLLKFFIGLKKKIIDFLQVNFSSSIDALSLYKDFFRSLFLGKSMENDLIRRLFEEWGIGHYLARSGLHIQILSKILGIIVLFFGFTQTTSFLIQVIFLFLFYIISFSSVSFFRSLLMFFFYGFLYFFLRIRTTSLHTVSFALIVTLLYNPFLFLELGVQLTFLVTTVLSLIGYKK